MKAGQLKVAKQKKKLKTKDKAIDKRVHKMLTTKSDRKKSCRKENKNDTRK